LLAEHFVLVTESESGLRWSLATPLGNLDSELSLRLLTLYLTDHTEASRAENTLQLIETTKLDYKVV